VRPARFEGSLRVSQGSDRTLIDFHDGTIAVVVDYLAGSVRSLLMSRHLTRDRLYRSIAGAVSLLILSGIAIFAASRHFAV
jgi:hypothetical protein